MRRVPFLLPLLAVAVVAPAQAQAGSPNLLGLRVTNGSTPFLGDGRLLTTVSPNGDGFRDAAHIYFRLTAPARVALQVVRTDTANSDPEVASTNVIARIAARSFSRGAGEIVWTPKPATPPRTYVLQLVVSGHAYRTGKPPVVRVQGIDAGFLEPSTHLSGLRLRRRRVPVRPRHSDKRTGNDDGGARGLVCAPRRARCDPARAAGRLAERAVFSARHCR